MTLDIIYLLCRFNVKAVQVKKYANTIFSSFLKYADLVFDRLGSFDYE